MFEVLVALFAVYLVLVQVLRYRRVATVRQITRAQLQRDIKLCHRVMRVAAFDMPFILETGTSFGLFRTYGIPTISRLLDATGEFRENCAKRYEDTDLLLSEMSENPLGEQRAEDAVKRLNAIHGHYRISNDDYLYTLTVFVCEPIRWTAKYDWRPMSPPEQEALCIYWQNIAQRMGMTDIPQDLEGMFKFNVEYEAKHMRYSKYNESVAKATIDLLVSTVPAFMEPFARRAIAALIDDRLLVAMGMTPASPLLKHLVYGALRARAFFVRHFMLPRWKYRYHTPKDKNPTTGRYMPNYWNYGVLYPEGYTLDDLGPLKFAQVDFDE